MDSTSGNSSELLADMDFDQVGKNKVKSNEIYQKKEHIPRNEYRKQLRAKAKERRVTSETVSLTSEELAVHFSLEKLRITENLNKNVDDRSRAGKADQDILTFLETVNLKKNIYTTSSCAGRAIVTQTPGNGYAIDWLFVDHRGNLPDASQLIWDSLSPLSDPNYVSPPPKQSSRGGKAEVDEEGENNNGEGKNGGEIPPVRREKGVEIWFKMEPPIVAIACASIETAQSLLDLARGEASLKNCSIRSTNNGHAMVALVDTHRIEAPLAKDGKLLINREYLDVLLDSAREKLAKGRGRMESMRKAIESKFEDEEKNEETK